MGSLIFWEGVVFILCHRALGILRLWTGTTRVDVPNRR